jgi:hypothetical protein
MSKRIRYTEGSDGFLVSSRMITTASGDVYAKFNPTSRVVMIVSGAEQVLHTWVSTTEHEIKKSIKAKLIEMGATFDKETRVHQ